MIIQIKEKLNQFKAKLKSFVPSSMSVLLTLMVILNLFTLSLVLDISMREEYDGYEHMTVVRTLRTGTDLFKHCDDPSYVKKGLVKMTDLTEELTYLGPLRYNEVHKRTRNLLALYNLGMKMDVHRCKFELGTISSKLFVVGKHFILLKYKYDYVIDEGSTQ